MIAAFFTKKHIWYYIAFIVFYRLGEGFVMKIVPLFLKADTAAGGLGLTNQQIGLYYGTLAPGHSFWDRCSRATISPTAD